MATVDVECSECGVTLQVDEARMGSTMTCPKCKLPFVVEPPGAYDLVDDRPTRTRSGRPPRDSSAASPAPERPETEEQRRIRERMERWAGDS